MTFPILSLMNSGNYPTQLAFLQSAVNTTNLTTYTFTSANLGTVVANRYIIVSAVGIQNTVRTLNSLTVAGVTATQIQNVSVNPAGGTRLASLWAVAMPSNSTGNIVMTFNGLMGRAGYAAWWATSSYDMTSPYDSANNTAISGGSFSVTVNTPSGGVAIAADVESVTSGTATTVWTGVSVDYNDSFPGATTQGQSGAHTSVAAGTLTMTASITNGTNCVVVGASWR